MLTLTCCQDHILTENIWFVCSETSHSGDEKKCYRCGTNEQQQLKIELLSQWKLEAESRNLKNSLNKIFLKIFLTSFQNIYQSLGTNGNIYFFQTFFLIVLYFFDFLKKKISNFLKKYDQPWVQLFRPPGEKKNSFRIFPAI